MKRYFSLLFLTLFISTACNRKDKINGIYQQGNFISNKNDRINTFYIYDFVTVNTIKQHAMNSEYTIGSETANYYFSYNANIPSQALGLAESISEANKLIDDYSYGIKYAFTRYNSGQIEFVDCSNSPDNKQCKPD